MVIKVSVITVTLNAELSILKTLENVRAQSYPYIEHVVVDGKSSDRTSDIVRRFSPDIFVSEKDDGLYCAMDKGAHLACGDILFFLNSGDVFYDERVVADAIQYLALTNADAIFGNLMPYNLDPTIQADHRAFEDGKVIDYSYFRNRNFFFLESIHHQTVFYKKEIFSNCAHLCEYPDATGEYHLHLCAFVREGYSLLHFPRTVSRFALGGISTTNFEKEWVNFVNARKILRKIFFPNGPKLWIRNNSEYLYGSSDTLSCLRAFKRYMKLMWAAVQYAVRPSRNDSNC